MCGAVLSSGQSWDCGQPGERKIRFLTWNIQSGGGDRIPKIASELRRVDADLVALTEVTRTNLGNLCTHLRDLGLTHIDASRAESSAKNSVLVASKMPLELSDEQIGSDAERWLTAVLPSADLNLLAVHIPASTDRDGKGRKGRLWDEVITYAQRNRDKRVVLLGDFNTGLAEDAEGTPFEFSDRMRILRLEKYVDTWRSLNPSKRGYTWYSNPRKGLKRKGFRLDYIFSSRQLADAVVRAEHDHDVRLRGLSDHSMVWAEINVDC